MYLVFAYVDIAWDVRSTVFLALAFALCADFRHALDTDVAAAPSEVRTHSLLPA